MSNLERYVGLYGKDVIQEIIAICTLYKSGSQQNKAMLTMLQEKKIIKKTTKMCFVSTQSMMKTTYFNGRYTREPIGRIFRVRNGRSQNIVYVELTYEELEELNNL